MAAGVLQTDTSAYVPSTSLLEKDPPRGNPMRRGVGCMSGLRQREKSAHSPGIQPGSIRRRATPLYTELWAKTNNVFRLHSCCRFYVPTLYHDVTNVHNFILSLRNSSNIHLNISVVNKCYVINL